MTQRISHRRPSGTNLLGRRQTVFYQSLSLRNRVQERGYEINPTGNHSVRAALV